jgi:DNA-directed RNA polymerase specialized sigma24 family protein
MKHDDERPRPVGCEEIARDRATWGRRRRGVRAPDRGGSGRGEPGGAPPRGRERRSERRDIEEAAVDLMRRRGREILATARRYAATPNDAEDAYQRGLEILLTKAPTSNEEELVPWLKTVVKHESFALRRQRERHSPVTDDGRLGERPTAPGITHDQAERYERLHQGAEAVRLLKPQEMRGLRLRAEGYSYKEILPHHGLDLHQGEQGPDRGPARPAAERGGDRGGRRVRTLRATAGAGRRRRERRR